MRDKFISKGSLLEKDIVKIKGGSIVLAKIKSFTNTTCKLIVTTVPVGSFILYYPVKKMLPNFFLILEDNSCMFFLIYCLAVAGSIYLYDENENNDLKNHMTDFKCLKKDNRGTFKK